MNPTRLAHRFLIALAGAFLAAAAFAEPLALDDIFGLEYAADPQIAPGGERIVYVRHHMDAMTDRNRGHLWLVDANGDNHEPLTTGDGSYGSPRFSPDGDRIAWLGPDDEGKRQLFVHWLDSGRTVQLTDGAQSPSNPTWSPDGRQLAFSRLVKDKPEPMAELPKPPEGAEWTPEPIVIERPVFRMDGRGFLPHGFNQLFVVSADGGKPRQVTDGPYHHSGPATWTADGKALLFSANLDDDWEYHRANSQIHRLDLDSGEVTALTDRYGPDNTPQLSPDGDTIAWTGYDDELMSYTNAEVHVMALNGDGEMRVLTGDLDRSVGDVQWSDDGRSLVISYTDHGRGIIDRLGLDGSRTRLAEDLGGTSVGRPYASGQFHSGDGAIVYTQTSPAHPGELVRIGGGEQRKLVELNRELLPHHDLAEVEEIRFESSVDGLKIQGWVAYPPGFNADEQYPLILEIHGGPFADYGPRFAMEIQQFAAAGYVVAYLNPRGSTSYGDEFANLIHHDYPGDDYHDLISGVDHLIERGFVDPDRLFVTGGSGGGVLSAWIVGKTDRFRAAAVVKPVINWTSFVLTGDMTTFFHKYWFPSLPWEDPEHYHERSPLSLAGNVTTPTMVMTGEADWRTPMWESEQFYQALKLSGVETALVRMPEAPHHIAGRPSQMAAKIAYILAWFERHDGDDDHVE